jgi:transcriptional regulator with XRE-family HTH domain
MSALPSLSRPVTIGEWIGILRHRKGWDQKTLAERARISATHLSGIERGAHTPTYETRRKLARAFGEPVATFLDTEEDDN